MARRFAFQWFPGLRSKYCVCYPDTIEIIDNLQRGRPSDLEIVILRSLKKNIYGVKLHDEKFVIANSEGEGLVHVGIEYAKFPSQGVPKNVYHCVSHPSASSVDHGLSSRLSL